MDFESQSKPSKQNTAIASAWCRAELGDTQLGDKRLTERLIKTAELLSSKPIDPINKACEDWASAKAAYRLFDNERVDVEDILSAHRNKTLERMRGLSRALVVQDSTFLNYGHLRECEGLGPISNKSGHKGPLIGLLMHNALAINPDAFVDADKNNNRDVCGVPLGIIHQKIWARKGFIKHSPSLAPIEQKESYKWIEPLKHTLDVPTEIIHVSDREADIYEYMSYAHQNGCFFVTRASFNRGLELPNKQKLWEHMQSIPCSGTITAQVSAGVVRKNEKSSKTTPYKTKRYKRSARQAKLEVRYSSITLKVPSNLKQARTCKPLVLVAIYLKEINPPVDTPEVEWMLLSNYPTESFDDVLERVKWYKMRWHIEEFHKVLKSGLRVEECWLESVGRLTRYITLCSIIAWRLYWMTKISRIKPDTPCDVFLAKHEWQALYCKIKKTTPEHLPQQAPTTNQAVHWIARLGGFLDRKSDGEPGITTVWRGWQRLTDIADDWLLFTQIKRCG